MKPKCPVCNREIEPLAEICYHCQCTWQLGSDACPAYQEFDEGFLIVRCELPYGHIFKPGQGKHRATGVERMGSEITLSWHYPSNDLIRSVEYRRRHG